TDKVRLRRSVKTKRGRRGMKMGGAGPDRRRPFDQTTAGPPLDKCCCFISTGICPVNRDTIDYILSKSGTGNAVVIVVGGAAESLDSRPGKNSVTIKKRKGFVKIAIQHGADLVPVYSFGENEAYKQVVFEEGSWGRWIQRKFQKYVGFAPCVFHGCGFLSADSWGLVPYANPINTVVGEPITVPKMEQPSQKDIDLYHGMYMTSLEKLFDKYKTKFGLSESDMLEIN
ncbi:unnamed protein product, partial [Ranitomeya imitator]